MRASSIYEEHNLNPPKGRETDERPMFKNSMFFIGLNQGDQGSYLIILDQDGELIEETQLPATRVVSQRKCPPSHPLASPWRSALTPGGPATC